MKAIVRHSISVYNALLKDSTEETFEGESIRLYRGPVSRLYASLGIAQSYYTEIFDQLDRQGSITYLQRGSKHVDTVIVLHFPPTEENFRIRPRKGLTSAENSANLIESVSLLKQLVGGINIVEALIDVDKRLKRLEDAGARENENTITQ